MSKIDNFDQIIEAALFVAGEPLSVERLQLLFTESTEPPTPQDIHAALERLSNFYQSRGIELIEVATGYRFQARMLYSTQIAKLWEKRPPRYSKATVETLALILYRQPISRGEIEEIRGVTVSSHIIKILTDRDWIRIVGYRDVPGKPALFGTTKQFLNDFNLKSLTELPSLQEMIDIDQLEHKVAEQLELDMSARIPAEELFSLETQDQEIEDQEIEENLQELTDIES